MKQVQHTQDISSLSHFSLTIALSLSGHTMVVINSVSQPRDSQSSHERIHIKGAVFAALDQSQTWTSLLAAERHILQTKSKL